MSLLAWLVLALPAFAQDADGDGFAAGDCNDADPSIYPGAPEGTVADGIDQDCSGVADDVLVCATGGLPTLQQGVDAAGDGFVVRVCAGRYRENVRVVGKQLAIVGTEGARRTGIYGGEAGPALLVRGGADVRVEGLTLARGRSASFGGGLRCEGARVDASQLRVIRSSARDGGGIGADDCTVSLDGVRLVGNEASVDGGNLWLRDSQGTLTGSELAEGTAEQGGGAFVDGGDMVIEGNVVRDNTATSTASDYVGGGGLFVRGTAQVVANTVRGNHAVTCGGGMYLDGGQSNVVANIVSDNTASDDGGGVYFDWSTGSFVANTVRHNDAVDDAGGLRVYRGSLRIEDNLIEGNTANDDGGGAKMSHASHIYRRNTHRHNTTGDAGGGLEMDNDTTDIEDCVFEGNRAGRGGGLHSWRNEGEVAITGSTFRDNRATDCGGGLAFDNDPHEMTLYDLVLDANRSDNDGGGLCLEFASWDDGPESESLVTLANSVVVGSQADDEGGFAYVEYGRLAVVNSVGVDNGAPTGGQGHADDDGLLLVRNTALVGGSGTVLDTDGNGALGVAYSALWSTSGLWGNVADPVGSMGVIAADPAFVGPGDYHLAPGSALIDAGDPAVLDPDGSVSDIGLHGGPGALP